MTDSFGDLHVNSGTRCHYHNFESAENYKHIRLIIASDKLRLTQNLVF